MGIGTESALLSQAKKAQGETNDRLDALIAEQRRTNQLLERIGVVLSQERPGFP
jgi:septum formation topological specificity factor MinE